MLIPTMLFAAAVVLAQTPDLEHLRWHSRVLLLFSDDRDNPELIKQKKALEQVEADLAERDLQVFELIGSEGKAGELRSQFGVAKLPFAVVLVGKDGGRKMRETKYVEPSKLFELIDSMPMRKSEMDRRSQQ